MLSLNVFSKVKTVDFLSSCASTRTQYGGLHFAQPVQTGVHALTRPESASAFRPCPDVSPPSMSSQPRCIIPASTNARQEEQTRISAGSPGPRCCRPRPAGGWVPTQPTPGPGSRHAGALHLACARSLLECTQYSVLEGLSVHSRTF